MVNGVEGEKLAAKLKALRGWIKSEELVVFCLTPGTEKPVVKPRGETR